MGKFEVGVLGGFNGKVGTVVGSSWRGIEYMRHKGKKSKKPPTLSQLQQRAKFGMVTHFTGTLNALLFKSYVGGEGKKTGGNLATSDILTNAITGAYPDYGIDFSKVYISKGVLQMPNLPVAAQGVSGTIDFSWEDNAGITGANADDKTVIVVYCENTGQSVILEGSKQRADEAASLYVPNFIGKTVHAWLAFYTADASAYASSIYTGSFLLS